MKVSDSQERVLAGFYRLVTFLSAEVEIVEYQEYGVFEYSMIHEDKLITRVYFYPDGSQDVILSF